MPVEWEDGWPVLGVDGKVPDTLDLPASSGLVPGIVASDEFDRAPGARPLPLVWQWNHNPDDELWSLAKRPGFLRLTTGRVDADLLAARNTLTQRTFGPECAGTTVVDVSQMKDGDFAGLALLQKHYGLVGVRAEGRARSVVMVSAESGSPVEVQRVPLGQKTVFLKAECDFRELRDKARFFYSLDGRSWTPIGGVLKMTYTLPALHGLPLRPVQLRDPDARRLRRLRLLPRERPHHGDEDLARMRTSTAIVVAAVTPVGAASPAPAQLVRHGGRL